MTQINKWSTPAKWGIAAVVGCLLTFGLCSVGTPFMGHGTPLQDFEGTAGFWTGLASIGCLLLCVCLAIRNALFRSKD